MSVVSTLRQKGKQQLPAKFLRNLDLHVDGQLSTTDLALVRGTNPHHRITQHG